MTHALPEPPAGPRITRIKGAAQADCLRRSSMSKKRLCRFFEKDHMTEGIRFLTKKSPLPP